MKTNLSPLQTPGGSHSSGTQIPGPRTALGSILSPRVVSDAQKGAGRILEAPEAVSELLTDLMPKDRIPGAVADFKSRFPDVRQLSQVDANKFFDWLEGLPIARTTVKVAKPC